VPVLLPLPQALLDSLRGHASVLRVEADRLHALYAATFGSHHPSTVPPPLVIPDNLLVSEGGAVERGFAIWLVCAPSPLRYDADASFFSHTLCLLPYAVRCRTTPWPAMAAAAAAQRALVAAAWTTAPTTGPLPALRLPRLMLHLPPQHLRRCRGRLLLRWG
jgi:hypothetical protein